MFEREREYSLQDISSDPSAQSRFWSHIQPSGMQLPVPLRHVNSSDEHTLLSVAVAVFVQHSTSSRSTDRVQFCLHAVNPSTAPVQFHSEGLGDCGHRKGGSIQDIQVRNGSEDMVYVYDEK